MISKPSIGRLAFAFRKRLFSVDEAVLSIAITHAPNGHRGCRLYLEAKYAGAMTMATICPRWPHQASKSSGPQAPPCWRSRFLQMSVSIGGHREILDQGIAWRPIVRGGCSIKCTL